MKELKIGEMFDISLNTLSEQALIYMKFLQKLTIRLNEKILITEDNEIFENTLCDSLIFLDELKFGYELSHYNDLTRF